MFLEHYDSLAVKIVQEPARHERAGYCSVYSADMLPGS